MDSDDLVFEAELTASIRVVTILVWAVVVGMSAWLAWQGLTRGPRGIIALGALIPIVLAVTWAFRPSAYRIARDGFAVDRPIGPFKIEFGAIAAVSPDPDLMRFPTIRVFGSGGFHGVYGRFWRKGLGAFSSYVTDPAKTVRIDRHAGVPVAVSPTNPEAFVEALRARLSH
ncbi:MAG: PH domain-containing protein [Deltaproteobacteria bacterium]|nr:PH domain-containing protein [Deltaproteobacteria bacterium]